VRFLIVRFPCTGLSHTHSCIQHLALPDLPWLIVFNRKVDGVALKTWGIDFRSHHFDETKSCERARTSRCGWGTLRGRGVGFQACGRSVDSRGQCSLLPMHAETSAIHSIQTRKMFRPLNQPRLVNPWSRYRIRPPVGRRIAGETFLTSRPCRGDREVGRFETGPFQLSDRESS